jgi:tripartite-type tricarboxylate transporter receptor subunit TctC
LFGVFAPGATPPAVIERLNLAIARVLALPAIRQRLLAVDNLPAGGSAADFRRQIAAELRANQALFAPR